MAKTYEQIQQQIEKLQSRAKALQAVEAKGVIARIREAIKHYGLTAEQLGFGGAVAASSAPAIPPAPKSAVAAKPATKSAGKSKAARKALFSDGSGNEWVGRGPRPTWLREALQAGRDVNEFRIGKRAQSQKTPMPSGTAVAESSPSTAVAKSDATAKPVKTSYGDDAGHTWSGMGPKPGWLKAAIEAGKALADFAR